MRLNGAAKTRPTSGALIWLIAIPMAIGQSPHLSLAAPSKVDRAAQPAEPEASAALPAGRAHSPLERYMSGYLALAERLGPDSRVASLERLVSLLVRVARLEARRDAADAGSGRAHSLGDSLRKLGGRLLVARLAKKADWKALFVKLVKVFMQYFLDLVLSDMFGTTGKSAGSGPIAASVERGCHFLRRQAN